MNNKKTTKRALISSLLSLVLCMSMLIGTTFAWFTDTATSATNSIVAGNLDIAIVDANGKSLETINFKKAQGEGAIYWEPGCTYETQEFYIKNNGNLDLKYEVVISGLTGDTELLEVITFTFNGIDYGAKGQLKAGQKTEAITISGHMDEEAGNKYMNMTLSGVAITVNATQLASEYDSFDNQYDAAAGTAFVGGAGTETNPYLIDEPSQLLNISEYYDEYTYFKVADGVETLDMTGVGRISLNGSFDGNGVEFVNLTTSLFKEVGKVGESQEIKISNFSATVQTTDGHALVRNIRNPGTTTFENVALHGYIEGQYNVGSFYNYGTANASGTEGANYTVSFVNTKSDATLVCTTGNTIGGMLGHGYEGTDYQLTINMDANSGYTGTMYTTNGQDCYQVMAMCSHATYILNGVETSRYDNKYPSTKLTIVAPTVGDDGYYVAPVDNAAHYVVYLNAQVTAYDANGVNIANLSGLTWNLGKETILATDGKVFDLIASAEIVNGTSYDFGYKLNGNALKIYSGSEANYASGWVTLQVNQYDADNTLLATGIINVYTIEEP